MVAFGLGKGQRAEGRGQRAWRMAQGARCRGQRAGGKAQSAGRKVQRPEGKAQRAKSGGRQAFAPNAIRDPRSVNVLVMVLLCLVLSSGCSRPMSYIRPTADLTYIKTVAIVPLKNLTQERGAEGKVMNVVAADVLRRGVFDVVEFGEVTKVLREEGFREEEGVISKNIAERAGKRLNVQAFIVGAVEEYGVSRSGRSSYPEVSVCLKLIDAKSYKILWEATHSAKGGTVLDRLFGIGKKSTSELSRELVADVFDTLFGG